jgi:4-diphosphocytidyl-2-C-methyl-D-erythritol kinase
MSLSLPAHAKLNLALAVGPPQPPRGYHPICSWFVPVELHDTVTIAPVEPGAPSRHVIDWAPDAPRPSPIDWPVEKDLAVRAHRLLEAEAGRTLAVEMRVSKRIPVGGGLGGGSSDAAAALVGLVRLFGLAIAPTRLRELSTKLGSDVAFFIDEHSGGDRTPARPAIVTGFGEHIRRIERVAAAVLLIFPPFGCPTGPVYAGFDRQPHPPIDPARVESLLAAAARDGRVPADELFNDLLAPARAVEPRLPGLMDGLDAVARRHGARVHMTGSGSTLFAILPAATDAVRLAADLTAAAPDSAVIATRLI